MEQDLEKLIEGEGTPASGEEGKETTPKPAEPTKSEEEIKKEEHLANLNRAIAEANDELKTLRTQKKEGTEPQDDDTPRIDFNAPEAKAWDRHIKSVADPLASALAKEKEEVEQLALREFLSDKPDLAGNAEKRKEFVDAYQALAGARNISGRNKDIVLDVMGKAYGAVAYSDVLDRERQERIARAKADGAISEVATDTGSTTYRNESGARRRALNKDETEAAIRMYGSVDNYWKALEAVNQ